MALLHLIPARLEMNISSETDLAPRLKAYSQVITAESFTMGTSDVHSDMGISEVYETSRTIELLWYEYMSWMYGGFGLATVEYIDETTCLISMAYYHRDRTSINTHCVIGGV